MKGLIGCWTGVLVGQGEQDLQDALVGKADQRKGEIVRNLHKIRALSAPARMKPA